MILQLQIYTKTTKPPLSSATFLSFLRFPLFYTRTRVRTRALHKISPSKIPHSLTPIKKSPDNQKEMV